MFTSVVEFLRRGRVDRGTEGGKLVVVVDSSKRKVKKGGVKDGNESEFFINDSGRRKRPEVDGGGDGIRWDGGIGECRGKC